MTKIAFIGAGSLCFARRLITDILHYPALKDVHFALMDIDEKRLGYTRRIAERLLKEQNLPTTVSTTLDRREALKDADFVIISILAQGVEPIHVEYEVPYKHGVDQCIGDTLGPAGVFRFLRTMPLIEEICREVADHARPNCWVLNYTNPMAMLTWAAYRTVPGIKFVGLCHSVQGTTEMLARVIDVPYEDVRYWVAGINHQAWVLKFEHADGRDLYPLVRERIVNSDLYTSGKPESETVRIEMLRHLGYFVTESSGHNSEYNPWFRKRADLLAKYTGPKFAGQSGYILEEYDYSRQDYEKELEKIVNSPDPVPFDISHEYGSQIINAMVTNTPVRINGNILNTGLISNLPEGCCVEVPCLVDATGVNGCFVGRLPAQCAALNRTNVNVQELAVEAYVNKCRDAVYHAIYYDPLTAAKLSLAEIRAMVDELFEVETAKGWLPELK